MGSWSKLLGGQAGRDILINLSSVKGIFFSRLKLDLVTLAVTLTEGVGANERESLPFPRLIRRGGGWEVAAESGRGWT